MRSYAVLCSDNMVKCYDVLRCYATLCRVHYVVLCSVLMCHFILLSSAMRSLALMCYAALCYGLYSIVFIYCFVVLHSVV